ncbi:squalene/phytoene synthase family protein [Candidatus Bipolaricaulota bacterium]|nr:squalene/phytoene synthase family protein [Candidatus Bipolaricaulota bacterium]
MPTRQRRAMCAVYAFCREADDIADGDGPSELKAVRLAALRERLILAEKGSPDSAMPYDAALGDTIQRFGLELDDLGAVIDGVEMDLCTRRYQTFEELTVYCSRVASAVGLSVLPILAAERYGKERVPLRERGRALGLALQLINILRDVRADYEIDRVYLPLEDLRRFRVSEGDLLQDPISGSAQELLSFEAERARDILAEGTPLFRMLPSRSRLAPALMAAVYEQYLQRIEDAVHRASLSIAPIKTGEKLLLLTTTWLQTRWFPARSS